MSLNLITRLSVLIVENDARRGDGPGLSSRASFISSSARTYPLQFKIIKINSNHFSHKHSLRETLLLLEKQIFDCYLDLNIKDTLTFVHPFLCGQVIKINCTTLHCINN